MKTFGFASVIVVAMSLGAVACSAEGGGRAEVPQSGWSAPPPGAVAAESAPAGYGSAPPAAAAPPPSDFASAPAPAPAAEAEPSPAERPGLGTQWGETRFSQVHEEPFLRASDDPFALATVRYDDRAGVDAMAAHHGRTRLPAAVSLAGGWVTMTVRGDRGDALDAVRVGDRTYVVGKAGERYSIVLSNRTGHRFEAVATVDGLDVINGLSGALSNRGYLIEPHATLAIDGFRRSDDTVAAFRFGRVADSYAAQTGSARDVGVIGVAFFAEQGDDARVDEARMRESANPFPADGRYARPPL